MGFGAKRREEEREGKQKVLLERKVPVRGIWRIMLEKERDKSSVTEWIDQWTTYRFLP